MRRLLITRGAPGVGKSTALRATGIDDYRLSSDELRSFFVSPLLTPDGRMTMSHEQEPRVRGLLKTVLAERMARGEFVVVDATHHNASDVSFYERLAAEHRYEVACLDLATVPLDLALAQNATRPAQRQVPEAVVRRAHEKIVSWRLPDSVKRIPWSPDGRHLLDLRSWLEVPVRDLSGYSAVFHVGDVQGCFAPLAGPGGLLEDGLRDDAFYVFVGDLCDRGPHNGEVLRWFLEEVVGRPNAAILWGNHEDHLHLWSRGREPVSSEFERATLPQLEAAGLRPEDADALCAVLEDCLFYERRGVRVMATHAGLSTVPDRPVLISTHQYSHGTGYWEDPVDEQFERYAPAGWHQVHGHRNHGFRPIAAAPRSFNLEDSVEYGGTLRAVVLDDDGFRPTAVRNAVGYAPFRERRHMRHSIVPQWMSRPDDGSIRVDPTEIERMLSHRVGGRPAVRVKSSQSHPHVVSLNFDKNVFYDGTWDEITVKARGLFLNKDTWEVVARSYDKFFNVSEREEVTPEALARTLRFPVTLYVKENGYLGILGYDRATDGLFFASKSTPDGDFAGWFREIAHASLDPERLEALRRFLRDAEASMAFEVIDPARDPHMIEYDAPKLVLLDVFRRSLATEKLPYKDLQRVGERFGLEVKTRAMAFDSWDKLNGWMQRVAKDANWKWQGRFLEGFVIEDSVGFQTKLKLGHYSLWKALRGAKDRVSRALEKGEPVERIQPVYDGGFREWVWRQPEAVLFLEWCKRQNADTLKADILTLRRAFRADAEARPAEEEAAAPWP